MKKTDIRKLLIIEGDLDPADAYDEEELKKVMDDDEQDVK